MATMKNEEFQYPISNSVQKQTGPLILMALLFAYVVAN
jgi:hypothetical protein